MGVESSAFDHGLKVVNPLMYSIPYTLPTSTLCFIGPPQTGESGQGTAVHGRQEKEERG